MIEVGLPADELKLKAFSAYVDFCSRTRRSGDLMEWSIFREGYESRMNEEDASINRVISTLLVRGR
jgi:hypothetical protein